jgi:hypothetical protein
MNVSMRLTTSGLEFTWNGMFSEFVHHNLTTLMRELLKENI